MFDRAAATQLRDSLPVLDFVGENARSELLQSYIDCYGLDFSTPSPKSLKLLKVRHVLGTFNSGPYKIVCQYFDLPSQYKKGTVFLLHGYFDHAGLYGNLIRHCLESGLAVIIYDLPGHGLSSGVSASIDSFRSYDQSFLDCLALAVQSRASQPWTVIGQSTGASLVIGTIQQDDLPQKHQIEHYILLAPLVRPRQWDRSYLLYQIVHRFINSTTRRFTSNSHDEEFLSFLRSSDGLQSRKLPVNWVGAMIAYLERFESAPVSQQELHIIQGTGDGTVDWERNLPALKEKFPNSKVQLIPGARHHLVNESVEYRAQVFDLIREIIF